MSKASYVVCDNCDRKRTEGIIGAFPWIQLSIPSMRHHMAHYDFCCVPCLKDFLDKYEEDEKGEMEKHGLINPFIAGPE
jgi:hypothetical protein